MSSKTNTTTASETRLDSASSLDLPTEHANKCTPATTGKTATSKTTSSAPKSSKMLSLLTRKSGCTLEELQTASGWQAHSVRGFLSGTVRKKLGFQIDSTVNSKGVRRYKAIKQNAV